MKLFFYDVDIDYVNYLKNKEISKRGYTKVPDIQYGREKKMICGVVLEINGFKYYVPVSSYKIKQKNNILIVLNDDSFNKVKGSLRFNYMFPVPDELVQMRDFSKENPGRAEFLRRQWVYCNSIASDIYDIAKKTYDDVTNNKDEALKTNACDFKILEEALVNYCK